MSDVTVDIAIIGGGIVGTACAYYLSRQGVSSTIIDGEELGSKASGLAYGGLNSVSGHEIPGLMWELSQYSSDLHASLTNSIREESNIDCKYRTRDTLNLAFSTKELRELRTRARWITKETHMESRVLKPSEIFEIEPRVSGLVVGGTLLRGTKEVDSHNLTVAMARAAGCVHVRSNVVSMQPADNKISLCLENKTHLVARNVVCANGTWITPLVTTAGIELDIPPLKGEILRLETKGPPLLQSIGWKGNYTTTKTDGLTWAGTTEAHSLYDESTTNQGRLSILSNLRTVLPNLVVSKIVRQTACLRPTTADGLPVIGRVEALANLFIATGAGRKGILYGPGMGKIIADILTGNAPEINTRAFSVGRFASTN